VTVGCVPAVGETLERRRGAANYLCYRALKFVGNAAGFHALLASAPLEALISEVSHPLSMIWSMCCMVVH
jgi:hypothetical protein